MSNKPTNRLPKDFQAKSIQAQPKNAANPAKSAQPKPPVAKDLKGKNVQGIAFIPLSNGKLPIDGAGPFTFAIASDGKEQVVQTPFGVIKISITSSPELAGLAKQVDAIFSGGLTPDALQQLRTMIASMPDVQKVMAQMPGLDDFLGQALEAMRLAAEGKVQPAPDDAAAAKPKPFRPRDISFEKFLSRRDVN